MDKIFVKDIHDKDTVDSIFLVTRKSVVTGKAHPFIVLTLRDRTGDLDARIWEDVEARGAAFERGDIVRVQGRAQQYQNRLQLKVDAIEKKNASEAEMADFAEPPRPAPGDRALGQIREIVSGLQDPHLKALCMSFLDDETLREPMRTMAAARSFHHSHPGGLADHTLSVLKLCLKAAENYPMADRDMLIAGAFLHDIGKLRELAMADRQAEYTDEGRFIGHLVIGAQMIHDHAAALPDFPRELETQLNHLVLAHHGTKEFGSPCLPQTLEALIVHYMDDLDSKVGAYMEVCQRDPSTNERWTDFQKPFDRYFYKGATATIHGKYAFESKKRRAQAAREAAEKARAAKQKAAAEAEAKNAADAANNPEAGKPLADAAASSQPQTAAPRRDAPNGAGSRAEARPQKRENAREARRDMKRTSAPLTASTGEMKFKPFEALAALTLSKPAESEKTAAETQAEPLEAKAPNAAESAAPQESASESLKSEVNAALAAAMDALSEDSGTAGGEH